MNVSVERKRLSLDVFKEKNVSSDVNLNQEGGAPSTIPCSVSLISIIILATSHPCKSDDCHP